MLGRQEGRKRGGYERAAGSSPLVGDLADDLDPPALVEGVLVLRQLLRIAVRAIGKIGEGSRLAGEVIRQAFPERVRLNSEFSYNQELDFDGAGIECSLDGKGVLEGAQRSERGRGRIVGVAGGGGGC